MHGGILTGCIRFDPLWSALPVVGRFWGAMGPDMNPRSLSAPKHKTDGCLHRVEPIVRFRRAGPPAHGSHGTFSGDGAVRWNAVCNKVAIWPNTLQSLSCFNRFPLLQSEVLTNVRLKKARTKRDCSTLDGKTSDLRRRDKKQRQSNMALNRTVTSFAVDGVTATMRNRGAKRDAGNQSIPRDDTERSGFLNGACGWRRGRDCILSRQRERP